MTGLRSSLDRRLRWCHREQVAPAEFLDDVVGRTTLVEHVGKSGAALERVALGDGRTVIVKRITPETDVTLEIFGEKVARELLLWQSGGLDRLPDGVEHAVLDGWVEGEDTTVTIRSWMATVALIRHVVENGDSKGTSLLTIIDSVAMSGEGVSLPSEQQRRVLQGLPREPAASGSRPGTARPFQSAW